MVPPLGNFFVRRLPKFYGTTPQFRKIGVTVLASWPATVVRSVVEVADRAE